MIYSVEIGDVRASMDDDQNDNAPMPDFAIDYLSQCARVAWATYQAMVDTETEAGVSEGE